MNELLKASIPAALPTLMVLVGILINKNDTNALRGDMNTLQADMNAGFREMRADFKAMQKQQHDDLINLMGSDKDQDIRITRLEERSN